VLFCTVLRRVLSTHTSLKCTYTCNTLQHIATHCNMLTGRHCTHCTHTHMYIYIYVYACIFIVTNTHEYEMCVHCTHAHKYTFVHIYIYIYMYICLCVRFEMSSNERVAVCCSVLQCVAVCCSVLQCVTGVSAFLFHDTFMSNSFFYFLFPPRCTSIL